MNRRLLVAIAVTTLVCSTTLILVSGTSADVYHLDFVRQPTDSLTTPLDSAFTYQGQLKQANVAVNDTCDFQFSLWDSLNNPAGQIGTTQGRVIAVTNGLFNATDLDFGTDAFNGDARWLQIAMRCPSGAGNYSVLTPRQSVTAAPYAQYSRNADKVDNLHASAFAAVNHTHAGTEIVSTVPTATLALSAMQAPWSGLTGIPAGLGTYTRTVIVSPVGTAIENGAALIDALAGITESSAANPYLLKIEPGIYDLMTGTLQMKPYVDVEGSGETVTTITAGGWLTPSGTMTGTVAGADNAELRWVTVQNTGGRLYAIAIYNNAGAPRLTSVTAVVSNGVMSSYAIYDENASPRMKDVTARALTGSGSASHYGIYNLNSAPEMIDVEVSASGSYYSAAVYNDHSSPEMRNVIATASEGSGEPGTIGIYNTGSTLTMTHVVAQAFGGKHNAGVINNESSLVMIDVAASAWGSDNGYYDLYCYGIFSTNSVLTLTDVRATALDGGRINRGVVNYGSTMIMNNVEATARWGGTPGSAAIYNSASWVTMTRVTATATEGVNESDGIYNESTSLLIQNSTITGRSSYTLAGANGIYTVGSSGTYTLTINNSEVTGSKIAIRNDTAFKTRVGGSYLSGPTIITGTGQALCAGVYDGNYTFYANTCP